MTVTALAKRIGVTPDTVRHYVRIGLVTPQRHQRNRYRLFSEAEAHCICFIHLARMLGYTLEEIGAIVNESRQRRARCPRTREILQTRIVPNRRKLTQLNCMQTRLEEAMTAWARFSDGVPDSQAVRRLMDAIILE